MSEVAVALQLDPGYVEGVATFYTLFHHAPIGKHRFYVCTNLSCQLRGSEQIIERLQGAIGVHGQGEVSKDGLFSYQEVECLGACEYAPVCRLDHKYEVDLTPTKIDKMVLDRRLPRPYQKRVRPMSDELEVPGHPHPSPPPEGGGEKLRRPRRKPGG